MVRNNGSDHEERFHFIYEICVKWDLSIKLLSTNHTGDEEGQETGKNLVISVAFYNIICVLFLIAQTLSLNMFCINIDHELAKLT